MVGSTGRASLMDSSLIFNVVFAFVLVFLNGWFVTAEFSMVRVRQTRLKELAEQGDRKAQKAYEITQRIDAYLASTQLGITLASLGLGWLGEPAIARLMLPLFTGIPGSPGIVHGVAITLAFLIITFLHVVLGEQLPKLIAIQKPENVARSVAYPLHLWFLLSYPLRKLLHSAAAALSGAVGLKSATEAAEAHSEEVRSFEVNSIDENPRGTAMSV